MLSAYLFTAVFGLLFGSFANVAVLRAGDWSGILAGRSRCPACKHPLSALDLVPVLSFLALGGRCRYCRKPISWQYPLVELAGGLLAVFSLWYGYAWHGSILLAVCLFFSLLFFLILATEDLISMEVSLPYCVIAGVIGGLGMWLSGMLSLGFVLLGAAAGTGVILAISWLWKLATKTDGMGSGDAWIAGAVGAAAGWPLVVIAFFIAVLSGAVVGLLLHAGDRSIKGVRLPFGPFLFIGLLVALAWGQAIIGWYIL